MSEESPERELMVTVFESIEDFKTQLRQHGKIALYEVKREKGFTYWFFCDHCHDFSILKTTEPFEYSYEIEQRPKTRVTMTILRVENKVMTTEEFIAFIYGDE